METGGHTQAESKLLESLKFCATCKASIPEGAFHDGHALQIGKKPVHVDCLLKRSATLPVLALLVGLVGAGLGAYALATQGAGTGSGGPTPAALAEADVARLAAIRGTADRVAGDLDALRQQVAALATGQEALAAQAKALADSTGRTAVAADEAQKATAARLQALEGLPEAVASAAKAAAAAGALDAKFNALAEAVTDLRKELLRLKASAPPAPAPPEAPR